MVFYCSAHALFSYVRLCSLYVYVLCIFICSTFYTFLCPYLILFFISTFLCLFVFFLFSHVSTRDVTEPAEIRLHRISHLTSVQNTDSNADADLPYQLQLQAVFTKGA